MPWLANAFALTVAAFLLPWGKLYATFNSKWLFITSVGLFEAGSAICGAAPTMNALIGARVLAGIGAIGIYIGVISIISANTTDMERPIYLGLTGAMWGLASVIGPIVGGGFVASAGGWRWVLLFINSHLMVRHFTSICSSAQQWHLLCSSSYPRNHHLTFPFPNVSNNSTGSEQFW